MGGSDAQPLFILNITPFWGPEKAFPRICFPMFWQSSGEVFSAAEAPTRQGIQTPKQHEQKANETEAAHGLTCEAPVWQVDFKLYTTGFADKNLRDHCEKGLLIGSSRDEL